MVNWDGALSHRDVNKDYLYFLNTFSSIIDKHCPITKFKPKITKNRLNLRWNHELQDLKNQVKDMRHLKDSLLKCERLLYKNVLSDYNKKIKNSKISFNENSINQSKNKSKAFWDIYNRDRKINNKEEGKIELIINDVVVSDPVTVANKFNVNFTSRTSNPVSSDNYRWFLPKNDKTFFFLPSNKEEVIDVIKSLNNIKCTGVDKINMVFLKHTAELIAKPISDIFNLSIASSCYPDNLKPILVRPLYKKGSRSDPGNYRGLNLTSNISKIFDNLFKIRIESFLEDSELISPNQHGFTKLKSTDTACAMLMNFLLQKKSQKKFVILTQIDAEKAFDNVSHELLAMKMDRLGFKEGTNKWIQSFTNHRSQVVEIDSVDQTDSSLKKYQSDFRPVNSGTFQGTTLGPSLFNLNLNDLFFNFPNNDEFYLAGFADDTPVATSGDDLQTLEQETNAKLAEIKEWFHDNGLPINKLKTNYMVINNTGTETTKISINIDGTNLTEVSECTYLGLTFTNDLQWGPHIDKLESKLNKCIALFLIVRNEVSAKHLLTLYYAYVYSNMKFGIIFWGRSRQVESILLIQKKILRIMFRKCDREHCQPIFKKERLLTVVNIFIFERCKWIFKNPDLFKRNKEVHSHNLRNKSDINMDAKTTNEEHSDASIFNKLPKHIKYEKSFTKFTKSLKDYLLDNPFYSLSDLLNS